MPGNLCRCDLLSEEGWALAMPVLLPITGRQCRPRAEGPPGRRSANTSWNIEDRPRLSFPITGCSCSLGGSNAIPGLVMATGFALRHSFWHLFRTTGSGSDGEGGGAPTQNPHFPPNPAPSVGSTAIQPFALGTARVNNQSQQICSGELSLPGRFVTTGWGKGVNEVYKLRESGVITSSVAIKAEVANPIKGNEIVS